MIVRSHRFHGHKSLGYAYRKGKVVRGQMMSLKYVVNSKRRGFRVAVVVSRKVHKSAVVRNRIRRRIYEVVRLCNGAIDQPYDMVFTVYSDQLASISAVELQAAVIKQLQRADIIKQDFKLSMAGPSRDIVKPEG